MLACSLTQFGGIPPASVQHDIENVAELMSEFIPTSRAAYSLGSLDGLREGRGGGWSKATYRVG